MKTRISLSPMFFLLFIFFISSCSSGTKERSSSGNLAPGHYPGDPAENFSPVLHPGGNTYRNVALHRASWHSSAYDYNLTAQLITDGIVDSETPWTFAAATSDQEPLDKRVRNALTDDNPVTTVHISGSRGWVSVGLTGRKTLPAIDGLLLKIPLRGIYSGKKGPWKVGAAGSNDGTSWTLLAEKKGYGSLADTNIFPLGEVFTPRISFEKPVAYRFYKVTLQSPLLKEWNIGEFILLSNKKPMEIKPSLHFTSAWMSEDASPQWLLTDLGAPAVIDSMVLHWIVPPQKGRIQISMDKEHWEDIGSVQSVKSTLAAFKLSSPAQGRYIRLLMQDPADQKNIILSELEAWGRGGTVPTPVPEPPAGDRKQYLSGGRWRLQRASQVKEPGEVLSKEHYDDASWLPATVPGTELVSYLNAGAIPDPDYADNQLMVSESFFLADFWYRNVFEVPASFSGKHLWLNFDGINWKAGIWLNGTRLGRIDGAFTRGRFDVTDLLQPGKKNVLAIKVLRNAHPGGTKEKTFETPGLNGGVLGADNPTFHATIGWDWIPTIRGRDAGIWNDVWIKATGPVTLDEPLVTTGLPLPDTTVADITINVTVRNHSDKKIEGTVEGSFGNISFSAPVTLEAKAARMVVFNPSTVPALHLKNPRLWWPAGYGQPNLYDVKLQFVTSGGVASDKKAFRSGIRQMSYSKEGGALKIWVNGKRFTARGGNWGFPESMLRYRKREYDIAVRYHRDMHFTMIRNWVGMTGDDEFWEACDKYGILVWQDFWLANPWDGPDPDDDSMFLANARDFILRIRNHPSIGLYCGRNEGYPPEVIDKGLRDLIGKYHPGLAYIPSSADDVVSGHGPYRAMPIKYYFAERATKMLHSEMGMPNIMTLESLQETIPDSALWPQGRMWGLHDYCAKGAQNAISFNRIVKEKYGGADNVKEWVTLAQFVNYDGYRAMFEAQSRHRMGLLLWMSHPCWPSLTWQTYDYYFEPTAAYFGCKKASEPLHIQWNALTDSVEAVNYSGHDGGTLTARIEIINMDGQVKKTGEEEITLPEDAVVRVAALPPAGDFSAVHFIRLTMLRGEKTISRNFYLRGAVEGDLRAIHKLAPATVTATTEKDKKNSTWHLTTTLTNTSKVPALMVQLKVVRSKSGDRVLPVLYSDNYIALMPGESRTVTMEFEDADCRGESPAVVIEGYNLSGS